jgi:hypothetical protein
LLSREYRRARVDFAVSLFLAVSVVYFVAPSLGDLTLRSIAPTQSPRPTKRSPGQPSTGHRIHRSLDRGSRTASSTTRPRASAVRGYSYRDYRLAYDAKANDVSKAL